MKFIGTEFKNMGGENVLLFHFEPVTFSGENIIKAGVPYLLKPNNDIVGIESFKNPIQFGTATASTVDDSGDAYAKFHGLFLTTWIEQDEPNKLKLMLISDNRLAEIEPEYFYGFRAYFQLQKAVPANTLSLLNFRKPASTDTQVIIDGKKVNVEKFLREGRVYIRVGETLYTITGEVVGDRR
jgi:hypothetical protein